MRAEVEGEEGELGAAGRGPSSVDDGRDEMNLAEFPLSPIADRFLDGRKTVVFVDTVWDRERREHLPRELAISGSDRYGLPTAKDEDVLLACIQLSSRNEFQDREVYFSRYELLKLLNWPDEGKSYQRIATALRRWKGVTIYSNRAFYDHARKSWVNRDFGVFDNLYLYEREASERSAAPASSRYLWNEVLFTSFQAGYLKRLDWGLYCRLSDPVAKRLYRLLDKRFYHGDQVVFDLHELAWQRIRVSENYNTAQIKRALANGIQELETEWELRKLPTERRFVKRERGKWDVVFERRRPKRIQQQQAIAAELDLVCELTRRQIGPAMADELVNQFPAGTVRNMIQLFDWYIAQGQEKGPGFLVDSIRRAEHYRLPRGFRAQTAKPPAKRRAAAPAPEIATPPCPRSQREALRQERFAEYWAALPNGERRQFEILALDAADATKRAGYLRLQPAGGQGFEHYRQVVLRDYFERQQHARKSAAQQVAMKSQPI